MCGIAAIVDYRGIFGTAEAIHAMTNAVSYRGPDDQGHVRFSGPQMNADIYPAAGVPEKPALAPVAPPVLWMGHRRLSIIDVSAAGHQPMCSPDGRYWIVYNGEIYNYVELRAELKALGHSFASQGDTEVILAAYHAWGRGCLARFNGMFAFLLFDRERGKLFAARDRFGVKPLYYWVSVDGAIAFSSEIKQFSVLPRWSARLNGQRAYDFLNWGLLDHTDETLFAGVFQLRGGEFLELDVGSGHPRSPSPAARLPVERWYSLLPRPFKGSLAEAGDEFRQLLTDSIRLRLRSDVPVGSCLSGGLDSSSIVCLMNELLRAQDAHGQQKTFSACSTVRRFDERDYIDEVVRYTDTDAHYVYPALDELFQLNDRITHHQDEPFGSTSIYAQWNVFRLAAENRVKVVLDGQGADEQLAGYHNYFAPCLGGLLRAGRLPSLWRELQAMKTLHGHSPVWGLKQAFNNVLPEFLRQPLRRLSGKPGTVNPWLDMRKLGASYRDPFLEAGGAKSESVRAMSLAQLTATSLPMLLHWEDRDSMAHSIEARVPFLDYRLVEFLTGLPDDFKIGAGTTKRVMREGMRGVLPERVRTRADKLGFVTPEEIWMKQDGSRLFKHALRLGMEASDGIVSTKAMDYFDQMVDGRRAFDFMPWRFISFGTWMRVFNVGR